MQIQLQSGRDWGAIPERVGDGLASQVAVHLPRRAPSWIEMMLDRDARIHRSKTFRTSRETEPSPAVHNRTVEQVLR